MTSKLALSCRAFVNSKMDCDSFNFSLIAIRHDFSCRKVAEHGRWRSFLLDEGRLSRVVDVAFFSGFTTLSSKDAANHVGLHICTSCFHWRVTPTNTIQLAVRKVCGLWWQHIKLRSCWSWIGQVVRELAMMTLHQLLSLAPYRHCIDTKPTGQDHDVGGAER